MVAPTTPWCTSADVAAFNAAFMGGKTDFDTNGPVKLASVDSMRTLISNHVSMQFQSAGYKIPFQELSGETWLDHQTSYLNLVTVLGISAKLFSSLMNAYPSAVRSGGRLGNILDEQYSLELRKIYNHQTNLSQIRFRAAYWPSTPAEASIKVQFGPISDYARERFDPTRTMGFHDVTELAWGIQKAFKDLRVPWDYMHELTDQGLGATTYDNY